MKEFRFFRAQNIWRAERAAAAIYAAIVIIPLLGVLAFGIDALNLQMVKQQLQSSVDTAALAAAYRLKQLDDEDSNVTVSSIKSLAKSLLKANANQKISTSAGGSLLAQDVSVENFSGTKSLTVEASYKVKTHLMWLLSAKSATVQAKAKAVYTNSTLDTRYYIVLADSSGSMGVQIPCSINAAKGKCSKMKVLNKALKNVIKIFPAEWGMSIIEFDNDASIKKNMKLNINKSDYKHAVNSLETGGGTDFIAPIKLALSKSGPIKTAKSLGMPGSGLGLHILLITDGNPHNEPDGVTKSSLVKNIKNKPEFYPYYPYCNEQQSKDKIPNDPAARFLESVRFADLVRELYPAAVVDVLMIGKRGKPMLGSKYECSDDNTKDCSSGFPYKDFFQAVSSDDDIMQLKDKLAWPYLLSRISLAINTEKQSELAAIYKDFPPPVPNSTYPGGEAPGFKFPEAPCMRKYQDLKNVGKLAGRMFISQNGDDVKQDLLEYFNSPTETLSLVE